MTFTLRAIGDGMLSNAITYATVGVPDGTQEHDFILVWLTRANATDASTVPEDWNLLCKSAIGDHANQTVWVYYKVATASEPTDYTWDWGATSVKTQGRIFGFYGDYDPDDPIDTYSNTLYTTSNSTCRAASIAVEAVDSPLLVLMSAYDGTGVIFSTPTNPAGWTEHYDSGNTAPDTWLALSSQVWSGSGATGNVDATLTRASGTPEVTTTTKHGILMALTPGLTDRNITVSETVSLSEWTFPGWLPVPIREAVRTIWLCGADDRRILRNVR